MNIGKIACDHFNTQGIIFSKPVCFIQMELSGILSPKDLNLLLSIVLPISLPWSLFLQSLNKYKVSSFNHDKYPFTNSCNKLCLYMCVCKYTYMPTGLYMHGYIVFNLHWYLYVVSLIILFLRFYFLSLSLILSLLLWWPDWKEQQWEKACLMPIQSSIIKENLTWFHTHTHTHTHTQIIVCQMKTFQ